MAPTPQPTGGPAEALIREATEDRLGAVEVPPKRQLPDGMRSALRLGAATSFVGQLANVGLGLVASIPIARGLGPSGKGEYAFYMWATSLAVTILSWGWHGSLATLASGQPDRAVLAVRWSRGRLIPAIVLLTCLGALAAGNGEWGWALVAVCACAQIWGQPASGALIGAGHLTAYYRGLLLQGSVFTGAVVALWSGACLSATSAVAGSTAGALVALVVHSRAVRAGFGVTANAGDHAERLSSLATHAWLANTATFFSYRLDFALVRLFTGTSGLGIYSTATAIAELGRTAPNALAQAALRHLGAASSKERRGVASYAALLSLVCAVATLFPLVLLSKWLVPLFYGPSFAAVVPVVAWLGPGIVLLAVASVSASWLNVSGQSSTTARLAWVGTAAAGLMALLLIPRWGVVGAAAASSVGYAVLAVLVWRAAARD